jgi:hypothetical protein
MEPRRLIGHVDEALRALGDGHGLMEIADFA